jgi:hypothetical protein
MLSESVVGARGLIVAVAIAASVPPLSAQTTATLANAGTLTCVTSDTPPAASADAELSCRFHAVSGRDAGFTGYIARRGQADLPTGKRVLVWSVLAATVDVEASAIAGSFSGQTGGLLAGRLVGGKADGIILDPADRTVSAGAARVPTVLELRLVPVKV